MTHVRYTHQHQASGSMLKAEGNVRLHGTAKELAEQQHMTQAGALQVLQLLMQLMLGPDSQLDQSLCIPGPTNAIFPLWRHLACPSNAAAIQPLCQWAVQQASPPLGDVSPPHLLHTMHGILGH